MHSEGPSNPRVVIAVTRQLNQLRSKAPDGVQIIVNDTDVFDIQAEFEGPVRTPYEHGLFRCRLNLPHDFPNSPPKGYFVTRIFHPNVSEKGEICVNMLKKDWNPTSWSFYNIFEVIKCLLIVPFPESALNDEAGKQFMEDYEGYFKTAKLMTDVHARRTKPRIQEQGDVRILETPGKEGGTSKKQVERKPADNVNGESKMNIVIPPQQEAAIQQLTSTSYSTATLSNSQYQSVSSPRDGSSSSSSSSSQIYQKQPVIPFLIPSQQANLVATASSSGSFQVQSSQLNASSQANQAKTQNQENVQFASLLNNSSAQSIPQTATGNNNNVVAQHINTPSNSNLISFGGGVPTAQTSSEEPLTALTKNYQYNPQAIQSSSSKLSPPVKSASFTSNIQQTGATTTNNTEANPTKMTLNLTFANFSMAANKPVTAHSFSSTSQKEATTQGNQQLADKKKWLKRI